jgi:hypothetical protein
MMQNTSPFSIRIALLSATLGILCSPAPSWAQGSAGGSIGNDDKSVSGSRPARAVEPSRPAQRSRPAESRRSGGGGHGGGSHGGGNLDGAWSISSRGTSGCADTFRETVIVTSGRMVGNYGQASVSSNGSVRGSGNYSGIGVTSRGRLSGRSGSGTFTRSDGCTGTWNASKQ